MFGQYAGLIEKAQARLRDYEKKQEVTVQSYDGLALHGYLIKGKDPSRTIVCVHGYRGSPAHDFGAAFETLLDYGDVLLIDQRAHGKSGGKYITYGIRECQDCKTWLDWLYQKKGARHPVYLDGISMGATTVLLTGTLELPENVRGIIADCGYTSPYDILDSVTHRLLKFRAPLLLSVVDLYCRTFAGFSLKSASTTQAMQKNRLPILFAHGTGDTLVPPRMTQAAFDACQAPKQLLLTENANHGMSYIVNKAAYLRALQALFQRCEQT